MGDAITPKPIRFGERADDRAGQLLGSVCDHLNEAERRAHFRTLCANVRSSTGLRGARLDCLLRQEAECEPDALDPVLAALDTLASVDHWHVLARYAALPRPA
ncbi:hypothetical protein [Methylobacterium haplocladii]|uniref:hypothetical protein n=1 Tax=Methylobacterium haplocladii TaxID=1176176 RepID=UPI0011BE99F1|nr:hypothetical protein [Methylobacterium haplocladii]